MVIQIFLQTKKKQNIYMGTKRAIIVNEEVFFGEVCFETETQEVVKLNEDTDASMNKIEIKSIIPGFVDDKEKSYGSYVITVK